MQRFPITLLYRLLVCSSCGCTASLQVVKKSEGFRCTSVVWSFDDVDACSMCTHSVQSAPTVYNVHPQYKNVHPQ